MAFTSAEMSLMAYTGTGSNGHQLWFYTNSAADTITTDGLFDVFGPSLNVGDLIFDVENGQFGNVTVNDANDVTVALVLQPSPA